MNEPKRPPWFIALASAVRECQLAATHGPYVSMLVLMVANIQDQTRRQGLLVPIFTAQLMPLIGVRQEDTLRSIRQKAIEAGWLTYQTGGTRAAGKYAAHIPQDYPGEIGSMAYVVPREMLGAMPSEIPPSFRPIPFPFPSPNNTSPSGADVVGDQEQQGKAKPRRKRISVEYDLEAIPLPLRDTGFPDAWNAYLEHRAQLGKPVTLASQNQSFKQALKIGGNDATQKIETAIENGWTGWNWKASNSQSKLPPQSPALPLFDPSHPLRDEPVFVPEDKADMRLKNKERTPN